MEQIPYLPAGGDKSEMNLSSDASWIYQGRSNVYSQINDRSTALPVTPFILVIIYLLVNMVCLWEDMTLRILV